MVPGPSEKMEEKPRAKMSVASSFYTAKLKHLVRFRISSESVLCIYGLFRHIKASVSLKASTVAAKGLKTELR